MLSGRVCEHFGDLRKMFLKLMYIYTIHHSMIFISHTVTMVFWNESVYSTIVVDESIG